MKEPDVMEGLRVARHPSGGWQVIHDASGMLVFDGALRLRLYAEQARADLLATGVDWSQDAKRIGRTLSLSGAVYALWMRRARQDYPDRETGEHYSTSTHYGHPPLSLAAAAHYRRALAWARELAAACQDEQSRAQVTEVIRSVTEGGEFPPARHRTPLMEWVCDAVAGRLTPWETAA